MLITEELLEKYHQGLCTLSEAEAVENWLMSSEPPPPYPENLHDDEDIVKIWQELQKEVQQKKYSSPRIHIRMIPAIAAMVVAALGIGYLFFGKEVLTGFLYHKSPMAEASYKYITTLSGERKRIVLPDGTVVHLNAGSSLTFPEQFTDTSRTAWLSGEGYFEISKDQARPFTIFTKTSRTQVVGTAFNLRAYKTDRSASLVVSEGKVIFSPRNGKAEPLTLTANQCAILSEDGKLSGANVYAKKYSAWTTGELVFDNLQLSEIAQVLERWYGVEVKIMLKGLNQRRCTGSFTNPSLESLMQSICYSMNIKHTIKENTVIIY